jgi:hypothetical protein
MMMMMMITIKYFESVRVFAYHDLYDIIVLIQAIQ